MIPGPRTKMDRDSAPHANSKKSPRTIFRTLFESGNNNDFDAVADAIADDCEWVLMSNMMSFKGKNDVVALCKAAANEQTTTSVAKASATFFMVLLS